MHRLPAVTAGLIAIAAMIAALTAVSMRVAGTTSAGVSAAGIIFHIDCNTTAAGIQDQCSYPAGTTQVDVDVVVENNTGADVALGALGFTLVSSPRASFIPQFPTCDPTGRNCNPDFNEAALSAPDWVCSPPAPDPDTDSDGNLETTESMIGCFIGSPPYDSFPQGETLSLARTRFTVTGDVTIPLSLDEASLFDEAFNELGSCPVTTTVPATCNQATIVVGTGAAPTSTPTRTSTPTPTATIAPQMTPSGTPTGAVTDILVLNEAVCIGAGAAVAGIDAITAVQGCQGMSVQSRLQAFVHCLTGGQFCPSEPPHDEIFKVVEPSDFAAIDIDGDSIQEFQSLLVIAFVDARYPVLFETDRGTFLRFDGVDEGPSVLCYGALPIDDPDCFVDTSRPGDGVVVKRLRMNGDPYRGPATVTVTQNGVSKQLPFMMTGSASTLTFTSIDGATEIVTGAGISGPSGESDNPDACDPVFVDGPLSTSPKKTNVFVQALDDAGTPVSGSLIQWDHAFPFFDRDPFAPFPTNRGVDTRSPQGGAALPSLMTLDFGARGIGSVLVACGGDATGLLEIEAKFNLVLSAGADPDYRTTFAIDVVSPPGVPPVEPSPPELDVVALNYTVCESLNPAGPNGCSEIARQGDTFDTGTMQALLCRIRACVPSDTSFIGDGSPSDFSQLDADDNRLHTGQALALIAFMPDTGPVRFSTNKGSLFGPPGPLPGVTLYDCNSADPDCVDDNPGGDGIVTAYLTVDETTARGPGRVTITQGETVFFVDFTVTGPPASFTIENPEPDKTLSTNDRNCNFPYTVHGIIDRSQRGYDEPYMTARVIRVLDSDGVEVVGVPISAESDFGDEYRSTSTRPTMDLGNGGFGGLFVFCSDFRTGSFTYTIGIGFGDDFSEQVTLVVEQDEDVATSTPTPTFTATHTPTPTDTFAPTFTSTATRTFTPTPTTPPPTSTPTPCPGDRDCDGAPEASDNCLDVWNPDQANNDSNFIDNSPPYAAKADDRTRPNSDRFGDACDTDDDNDGISDDDETAGPPCFAASSAPHPLNADTDGDLFLDGAECALGTDPVDTAAKPSLSACGPPGDLAFGILNAQTAFCFYGIDSDPLGDSDNDLGSDGSYNICEIVSLNADRVVNVADMGMLAFGIARATTLANIDLNRDGSVNAADQGAMAAVMSSRVCPMTFN